MTVEQYPRLCASRLYAMVRERGYQDGADHFRHLMSHDRPRAQPEAYRRLKTLPGEQAQVDWGHFGTLTIGRAVRPLMVFEMVLSWSRQILRRFFPDVRMASFLRGHEAAFPAWGGRPRVLLYDNLKSAVLERQVDAIRYHPTLLAMAAHDRFEPRPVAVARGNEKGRVERSIRYVRDGFFVARTWRDLEDLNAQAGAWCRGQAAYGHGPEERRFTVREAFAQEQPRLLALPDHPFPTEERVEDKVGKTPYARFDFNDYSLPYTHVQRLVTVVASPEQVRVLDGATVLSCHPRSDDKGVHIEDEAHVAELNARQRATRRHRGQDRLAQAAPNSP